MTFRSTDVEIELNFSSNCTGKSKRIQKFYAEMISQEMGLQQAPVSEILVEVVLHFKPKGSSELESKVLRVILKSSNLLKPANNDFGIRVGMYLLC